MKNADRHTGFFVFIVFLGAIAGSLAGEIIGANVKSLSFLRTVYSIGTTQPFALNLRVMSISLGLNFNINLMSIFGVILAIILYRKF